MTSQDVEGRTDIDMCCQMVGVMNGASKVQNKMLKQCNRLRVRRQLNKRRNERFHMYVFTVIVN